MKHLRKTIIALSLTMGLSFVSTPCAKADLFGIADGALLTQQILQFIQDFSNTGDMIDKIADGMSKVEDIFNKIETGEKALATVRSIKNTYNYSYRTVRYIANMEKYFKMFGSDFDIRAIGYMGSSVVWDIENLYSTMQDAIMALSSLFGRNGGDSAAFTELKNSMEQFENYCENRDHGVRHQITGMIKEVHRRSLKKRDIELLNLSISC